VDRWVSVDKRQTVLDRWWSGSGKQKEIAEGCQMIEVLESFMK